MFNYVIICIICGSTLLYKPFFLENNDIYYYQMWYLVFRAVRFIDTVILVENVSEKMIFFHNVFPTYKISDYYFT